MSAHKKQVMATFASCFSHLAERWRAIDPAWRWAVGVFGGARILYTLWSVVILLLAPSLLENLDLFGAPVVASFDMGTGERHVYSRVVNGETLTFRRIDETHISDNETGSVWDVGKGRAVSGKFEGAMLAHGAYTEEDVFPYRGVAPEPGWFGLWQRFDVLWYEAIAQNGYGANAGDVHFPPLYPLLEGILGRLLGGRFLLAGWLIAQAALVWSLALLYGIAKRWGGEVTARRTIVFLVLFPTAFFLMAAYSEALFLLLSLLAFRALELKKFGWAGFFVMLAILTRLQGIALVVPLAYCAWQEWRGERKITLSTGLMLGLPVLAGLLYLGLRAFVGGTNILPTSEPQLNARLAFPWENVAFAVQTIASGKFLMADVLNLVATILAIFVLVRGWRLMPMTFSLYGAATVLVVMVRYVDTQPLNSMTRYLLTLFPLFMLLAYWSKNRWVERAVVYGSLPLGLYLMAQFLVWGWVA